MGRKAIPKERRNSLVRDQRLVTMLTAEEKERVDSMAETLGYLSSADLVREALSKFLDAKEKKL
jgi:hypothetical protein